MQPLLFLVCISLALAVPDRGARWTSYKNTHQRTFKTVEEEAQRRAIWETNVIELDAHNQKHAAGISSFSVAENFLTDKTPEERKAYMGLLPPTTQTTTTKPTTTTTAKPTAKPKTMLASTPTTVDYRTSSCIAPIKNQGSCGSCYAFATTAVLEYYNCKRKGVLVIGSEQQIVDCDTYDFGCGGGVGGVWDYLIGSRGMCSGATYSYTAATGTCKKCSCAPLLTVSSLVKLPTKNETFMMETLANVGPVAIGINANNLFGSYSSGVFDDPTCPKDTRNHAVVIVGYTTVNNIPVWIIRNSWGNWGMNGYMYIKRGVDMCSLSTDPSYPVV